MKKKPFYKGKTFYSILRLLVICIAVPILIALLLTQRVLERSHNALQTMLGSTLESQMEYAQQANPGRNHTVQLTTLRTFPLLKTMGEAAELKYGPDVQEAEAILLSVTPTSDYGQITTYLYFAKSDYLIDSSRPGTNAVGTVDPHIFCGFDDLDTGYTGVPRAFMYNEDSNGNQDRTVYTATVFPNVIFIFDIRFPEYPVNSRPDLSVSDDFTAVLKDVEICYYDSYGNARVVSGNGELISLYHYSSVGPDENSYFTFHHDGHIYMCHCYFNEHNMTKYALFCRDEIAEEQHRTTILIWTVGAFLLIACLAWAFLYTRRTYEPIGKLVNRLGSADDSARDEFEFFNKAIDSFDDRLNQQNRILTKYYLLRILRGQKLDTLELDQDDWFQDDENCSFAVAALRVDEFRGGALYDEALLEGAISTFFKAEHTGVRTVFDSDFLYIVFRLPRSTHSGDLLQLCQRLQQHLSEYYISIYISDIHNSARELRRCYSEAMAVSEYYIANERISVIANRASTPQATLGRRTATPDFAQLRKLSDCITSLALEDALSAFDDLAFQFVQADQQPLRPESPLFNMLVNTIALAVYDIDMPGDAGKAAIQNQVTLIRGAATVAALRQQLQDCLQSLSRKSDGQEYYFQRFEKVRDHILEHYSDPNLDAASIAEVYNMSPSTITRLFRKYNNTGFLEFVHQTRVEKATKLLQQTDLPISEISALVGYTNAATMSRAFKAHANATPSMIRKRAQKEQ